MTLLKTSPAWSAKRQLSGNTIAARPPGFSTLKMCWTKLSWLLEVEAVKSSRLGAWLAPGDRRFIGGAGEDIRIDAASGGA